MKKLLISVLLAAVMAIVWGCNKNVVVKSSSAVEEEQIRKTIADRIIGTWVLAEADRPGIPSGIGCRLKSFTGTHWMITQPDPKTGLLVFQFGGRYTLEGDMMTGILDFTNASSPSAIGVSGRTRITIDGDVLKEIDIDRGVFNATWKRCKPTQSSIKLEPRVGYREESVAPRTNGAFEDELRKILAQIDAKPGDKLNLAVPTNDLSGIWSCNNGGTYYLRQFGNEIWWYGEDSPINTLWSNVAHGTFANNILDLNWTDVPKGHILGHGILKLELNPDGKIVTRRGSGGFGCSVWTRVSTAPGNGVNAYH
jgi:hypothetical protein